MTEHYKKILINSFDALVGTDTDFFINLNGTFPERFSQVCLRTLIMTNTLYNVDSTNNTFVFQETGESSTTVTLTAGNYSITSMITALQTALDAASPNTRTYTITTNTITNKLTITGSAGTFKVIHTGGLNLMLGFSTSTDTSAALAVTAGRIYNLTRYGGLNLYLSACKADTFNTITGSREAMLAYIPICEAASGDVYPYLPHDFEWTDISIDNVDYLHVRLADDTSTTVNLNGGYMSVYLLLR